MGLHWSGEGVRGYRCMCALLLALGVFFPADDFFPADPASFGISTLPTLNPQILKLIILQCFVIRQYFVQFVSSG
jgi:hypothetical protein